MNKEQLVKVRKLLRSKSADNLRFAIEILRSVKATPEEWQESFSETVLSLLVGTWDMEIWSLLIDGIKDNGELFKNFNDLAAYRFQNSGGKQQIFKKFIDSDNEELLQTLTFMLSKHEGDLDLDGLTSLSDAAAEALSKHKGGIELEELVSQVNRKSKLSDSMASLISKSGGVTDLRGLTSLSDAAAEALSKHVGNLDLRGLTSLSDTRGHLMLAEALSKHKGGLDFGGLTSLSDAATEALSRHKGDLDLEGKAKSKVTRMKKKLGR